MSSVLSTQGLTEVVSGHTVRIQADATRGNIVAAYMSGLNPMANLLTQIQNSATNTNMTSADLQSNGSVGAVSAGLTSLITLAQNGLLDKADPTDPKSPEVRYYLTGDMATSLNQLIESFNAVGIKVNTNPPSVSNLTGTTLRQWLDLSNISPIISQVMANCQKAAATATSTLQALVELEYVTNANNTLSTQMISLQDALNLTQNVLSVLTNVQQLHNEVAPASASKAASLLVDSTSNPIRKNKKGVRVHTVVRDSGAAAVRTASAYNRNNDPAFDFKGGIIGGIKIGGGGGVKAFHRPAGAFTNIPLTTQQIAFKAYASAEKALQGQLTALSTTGNASTELYRRVLQVLNDMKQFNSTSFRKWYLDSYSTGGVTGKSGIFQNNISFAINSAENQNSSQQQKVQQFMFTFQEYYQSASTILAKLSQIIEQAGQAIKG